MGFFSKKDKSVIPPVAPPAGAGSGGGSNTHQDPYARPAASGSNSDPYARSGGSKTGGGMDPYAKSSDPYAKSGGPPSYRSAAPSKADAQRNELFAGYTAPEIKPERKYGEEGRENDEDFDEDEEVEGIKQEMRGVKQESLASTRNALRLAREAEETARGTMAKLGDQSERIANSERYLDAAKSNNLRAEDKAAELKQLNKSIFRPVVTWNKDAKRQAEEDKINERHLNERIDREKARLDVSETRQRLNAAANPSPYGSGADVRQPRPGQQKAKKDARARYQFDATASDDELEDELDDNLDETLEVTKRLKSLASAMGQEVGGQNQRLVRVTDKTEGLEFAVMKNTERLKRIGK